MYIIVQIVICMHFWCILDTLQVPGCVLAPPTLSSTHQPSVLMFRLGTVSENAFLPVTPAGIAHYVLQSTDIQVCSWSSHVCACCFEKLPVHYSSAGLGTPWESSRKQAATQIVTFKHFYFTMRKNMHQLFSWHCFLWRQGCAKMEELLKYTNDIRERNVKVRFLGRWGIKTEYKLDSRGCWLGVILFFSSFKSIVKILLCLFK